MADFRPLPNVFHFKPLGYEECRPRGPWYELSKDIAADNVLVHLEEAAATGRVPYSRTYLLTHGPVVGVVEWWDDKHNER